MNPVCREAFDKAKNLIKLRKENMGTQCKPEIQNLDSGILLQFFENWENTTKNFNGKEIDIKRRVFDVLNHKKIHDVTMYFADDFDVKDFQLEHNILYINLDGSFDFTVGSEVTHMKPFSVATFEKGTKLGIKNFGDVNYLISVKFESPIF